MITFSHLKNPGKFLSCSLLVLITHLETDAQTPVAVVEPVVETRASIYRFTGTITSERSAAISPRVAGLVEVADADIGFSAKKGDLLVSLDDKLAKLDLEEFKLNLEVSKAELANAKRLVDEAIELGDANFPRSERENRETDFRKAQIAVRRLENALVKQAEIVERHRILAPFDGIVSQKDAEVGEWVQTGRPVLNFVDIHNLRLDVRVPQEQLQVALDSETVTVQVGGMSYPPFEASIEARSPNVDPQTRTFTVRIAIENPPGHVKPGMSADADFNPDDAKPNLLISRDAILRKGDSEVIVWVADDSSGTMTARSRSVTLGATVGGLIEVTEGLSPNEKVIYQGNELLQEGQEVRIVESVIPITR